jgi:trans-2-enoyl-CoA reductase
MKENNVPKKVILFKFGLPLESLDVQNAQLAKPNLNQVAVRLLAAPINPSDLGVITGTYAQLPHLPAVPGREGLGEIYAIGNNVQSELLYKRVRMPLHGAWQDAVIANCDDLIFAPDDLSIEMTAMSFINPPTAWYLLHDFVLLKPGDWIVQNAANSAVGTCVIQLAHYFGFRTINIVRDISWEGPLKALGADIVLHEDSSWADDPRYTSLAKLALNSVGGPSSLRLIKALADNGTHVTFGGMVRNPIVWPTRDLIFRNITIRGFSLDRIRATKPQSFLDILNSIFVLIRKGIIDIPVEKTYSLMDVKKAIAHAENYHRKGKILLTSSWNFPTEQYDC